MQVARLRMESQFARISMNQTQAQLEILQPKAEMQISQPKADFNIRTTKGKLTIDQTQAWAEANLKSALRWTDDMAQQGKQLANEGTARRAEQGAALLDIHTGQNVVADQAIENGHPHYRTPSIKYIPSPFAVKIDYQRGDVDLQAHANKPEINVQVNKPQINAHRGQLNIGMEQYQSLKIETEYSDR